MRSERRQLLGKAFSEVPVGRLHQSTP
jgi:hypothetical protein